MPQRLGYRLILQETTHGYRPMQGLSDDSQLASGWTNRRGFGPARIR